VDKETTDTTVPEPQKKGHYSDYEDIHTVHRKPGAHTSAQNDYNAVTKSNDDQSEALAAVAQAHKEEKTTRQPVDLIKLFTFFKELVFNNNLFHSGNNQIIFRRLCYGW